MENGQKLWVWSGGGVVVVIGPGYVVTGWRGLKRLAVLVFRGLFIAPVMSMRLCWRWGTRRC